MVFTRRLGSGQLRNQQHGARAGRKNAERRNDFQFHAKILWHTSAGPLPTDNGFQRESALAAAESNPK
jgi:hypothetical protein